MGSGTVKTLVSVVFLVLFAVEFIWLVKERKRYARLAILEAGSVLLAVVLTFVFDHFQGDEYEARSPWLYPWVLCQMMAIIFAIMLGATLIIILYRKEKGIKDESPRKNRNSDYPFLSQLIGVEEEKIRDLHKRIRRRGIPDHIYVIGTTPYCEECFNLLKREDGKWEVFYGERGQKTNPLVFDTFEEAGENLISRF